MINPMMWLRYASARYQYSVALARRSYREGKLNEPEEVLSAIYKTAINEKLTTLHWFEGKHMPILGVKGNLLVRRIPEPNPKTLRVGDVVLHKDPTNANGLLVRRIAALEDCEVAPKNDNGVPFTLLKDECWVLTDNLTMSVEEAHDSRTFGPVYMPDILGRPIYFVGFVPEILRWQRGRVWNSEISKLEDEDVIQIELDVGELSQDIDT